MMTRNYFHINKTTNVNNDKKNLIQSSDVYTKSVVDINVLLNKVKIEEKNQIKKKIIFFSFITLTLIFIGFCITIIK